MTKTIFMTGLPCSGKTTIAEGLFKIFKDKGVNQVYLDGDVVREGLNEDLFFSTRDRIENLRRISQVCKILNNQSILAIASFVSPTKKIRKMISNIIGEEKIIWCYVKCSVDKCIERDVKGMYKKALNGQIPDFTGVNAVYEEPQQDKEDIIIVDSEHMTVGACIQEIINSLTERGVLN